LASTRTGRASGTQDSSIYKVLACLLVCVLQLLVYTAQAADDLPAIQAALAKQTVDPALPLAEMKAFLSARIIQPPRVTNKAAWQQDAKKLRRDALDRIVFRGRAAAWRDAPAKVEWLDTIPADKIGPHSGYTIRKFRYEALPGMWIPGLLYQPEKPSGKMPLALHVNGHDPIGKAVGYKQIRSINLAKRGMLVLNVEWFGMGQLRTDGFAHGRMNQLELCGASGLAPFYLAMSRALDLGLALDGVDPTRVAVSGLSGGGWQTILISSLDERVTLANPVAGFGSFHTNIAYGDMGDSEQAPTDLAALADYTHLVALRAPRPTLLTYNIKDDCCFQSGHALEPLLNAARPIFNLYGAGFDLRAHVNHDPGTHNFEQDNREQFYAFLGDQFFRGEQNYPRTEIACQDEVKTPAELEVPLPENNVDFSKLAASLAAAIPASDKANGKQPTAPQQQERRQQLARFLRVPSYEVTSSKHETVSHENRQAESYQLKIGGHWTVPATEFVHTTKASAAPVILIADAGSAAHAGEVERLLAAGHPVLTVDPLLWGASKIKAEDPDYLYPLFLASVGERPLGLQAAQLAAIARWRDADRSSNADRPLKLIAIGPRASAAALVASALEPNAIGSVELVDALTSFRQIVERNLPVEAMPELFAFGLLEEFDVPRLVELSAPREVRFRASSETK
jgi:hypothetical protein